MSASPMPISISTAILVPSVEAAAGPVEPRRCGPCSERAQGVLGITTAALDQCFDTVRGEVDLPADVARCVGAAKNAVDREPQAAFVLRRRVLRLDARRELRHRGAPLRLNRAQQLARPPNEVDMA